jgi:hypothetical protein
MTNRDRPPNGRFSRYFRWRSGYREELMIPTLNSHNLLSIKKR